MKNLFSKRNFVLVLGALAIFFLQGHSLPKTAEAASGFALPSGTWQARKKITIDHTKVSANLSDFPLLYKTTDPDLRNTAFGGYVGKNDGSDILFTDSDKSTKLSHQLENYNPLTGEIAAWVKVPSISSTTDTVLYAYLGNASSTEQQMPAQVWDSGFKAVYHLSASTTPALAGLDSTSNGNSGLVNGPVLASGTIASALSFDGSNDLISVSDSSSLEPSSAITISAWVKVSTSSVRSVMQKISTSNPYPGYALYVNTTGNGLPNTPGYVACWTGDSSYNWGYANVNINDNNWHHIVCTNNGTTTKIYNNGVEASSQSRSLNTPSSAGLKFGQEAFSGSYFPGVVDEARISNTARSAAWILAEHNNQSDPGSFYEVAE